MTRYEIRPGTFAPCELFAVDESGELYIAGSDNLGETLVLMLRFQHQLVTGKLS